VSATGSAPSGSSSLGFRPGLDGIRAVAVLAVMAYHLDAPWMRGGFLGVDLFMVLSGYLITSLLLLEHERSGRVSLGAFWARRVRRILPAVVVLLTALVVYAALWSTAVERASLRWDSLASLTSWANWRFIVDGSGYWAAFDAPSPLTHFWSLSVEEQFYLVWPLVVAGALVAAAGRRTLVAGVAAAGLVASAITMAVLYDPLAPSRAYLGTDTRVQTLLMGALGAALLRPGPHRVLVAPAWWRWATPVAAGVVVLGLVVIDDQAPWMYRGGFTAFALAGLVVVIAAGEVGGAVRRVLGLPLLVWIGRRSFGWYLWHWPLIVLLTPERIQVGGAGRVMAVLVLTVAAAEVSFQLVEQPVRTGRFRLRTRRVPLWALASAAVAMVATVSVVSTRVAMPERPDLTADALLFEPFSQPVAQPVAQPVDQPDGPLVEELVGEPERRRGLDPFPGVALIPNVASAPRPTASTRPVERVLIQGDSVALFASLPMVEAFALAGIEVENRTFPGQSLANPEVLDVVARSGADLSIWQLSLWDTGDIDEVRRHHEQFVEASIAIGADVVFVDRPPVRDDLETEARQGPRLVAGEMAAAHPGRVHLLDPAVLWGDRVVLDRDGDGLPERFRDEVHVCPQGSARWTAWLLATLASLYAAVTPGDPAGWIDGTWLDSPHWAANPGQCDLL
jgi:peptidoglycan/LPS O-acetylase OafA/YrhL